VTGDQPAQHGIGVLRAAKVPGRSSSPGRDRRCRAIRACIENREQPGLSLLPANLFETSLLSGRAAWAGMNLLAEGLVRRAWDAVRLVVPGPPEGWGTRAAVWHGPPPTC
jgi:hypothetical protein